MAGLLEALRPILALLLGVLLDLLRQRARPTAEDSDPDREIRNKLRTKVRKYWIILLVPLLCAGCGVRTIYVPHGTPVRLRQTVKDAKVWVKDADGKAIAGKMNLPEGWYCLPMPKEEGSQQ